MGLDVNLYQYKDFNASKIKKQKYQEADDRFWLEVRGYDVNDDAAYKEEKRTKTQEERDALYAQYRERCKAYSAEHGLDEWGNDEAGRMEIEMPSHADPDHYCKIGYFRSSYNESGLNNVLRNAIGKDLYYIFQRDDDEYEFTPDWNVALERAKEVQREFQDHVSRVGACKVSAIEWNEFTGSPNDWPIDSEAKALSAYEHEKSRHDSDMKSYSNKNGEFHLGEPLRVLGLVRGVKKRLFAGDKLPCVYVVYEVDGGLKYYTDAISIVIETIEYVLGHDDPGQFVLSWSS